MRDTETNSTRYLSVLDVLAIARRWWWMLLVPLILAVGAAVVLYTQTSPAYQSEAEVLIRTEESANLFPLSDSEMLLRSPSAEAGFLASTDFEQAAMVAAGSDNPVLIDVGDLSSRVEPSFISFRAREATPELAATVAQAWAETYVRMRDSLDVSDLTETTATLESRLTELDAERAELLASVEALDRAVQLSTDGSEVARLTSQRLVILQSLEPSLAPIEDQANLVRRELAQLRVVGDFLETEGLNAKINRRPEVSESPVAPSLPVYVLAALVLGLLVGGAAVILAETLDDRVRSATEVTKRFGLQNLATVPFRRRDDASPTVPPGPVAESFHRLASAIDFCSITEGRAQVLLFTSAQASVSKTSTVSRLGATLARQGRRTLIIGADMRLPALAGRFDDVSGPGLGELLGGLYRFSECVSDVPGHEGLSLVRAGTVATEASPVDLLRNASFGELIEELRPHYDHILIDSPPILPVVDALEILRVCDGVVLTLFAGRSRFGRVERALAMLVQSSRKPILGFVLTGAKGAADSYTGGYYGGESAFSDLVDLRREAAAAITPPPVPAGSVDALPSQVQNKTDAGGHFPPPVVQHSSIDDIEFVVEEEMCDSVSGAVSSTERKNIKMRALRNLFVVIVALASLVSTAPAGAQYEGDSPETGVLTVPANAGPDNPITFTHTGLKPFSDVTFTLETSDGDVVAGLEVAGAFVVRADADGNYSGDVILPEGIDDGVYTLSITGTNADDSAFSKTYAISVTAGAVSETSNDALALTGSDSRRSAFNGVLIIAVGLALVAFAARTRSSEEVTTSA